MAAVAPPWAARTMEDLRAPGGTWGEEIRAYEHEKRRVVDEGLVRGQQLRLPKGAVRYQERVFDPLLQRFRDIGVESQQRVMEERERVAHLNRAQDIDIVRSQPFNVITHTSKLEALAPGQDPMRLGGNPGHGTLGETRRTKEGKTNQPTTFVDYNIVSNLPFDVHHWQKPGERPHAEERQARGRKVPHWSVKDFDIVTNRYSDDHEVKLAREKRLNLLEATYKHSQQNRFNPVSQQFNDPRQEERAKAAADAREVEGTLRAEALVPPSYKGRESAHYGILSHEVYNPEMVKLYDKLENERKDQYKNRYIVEHNFHVQDVKHDHVTGARKLNRVAPERFQEEKLRGYDIIDNRTHGRLSKEKQIHEDLTTKRPTPWERAHQGSLLAPSADFVQTIRMPEAGDGRLAASSSAPQLRAPAPQTGSASGRHRCYDAASSSGGSSKRSSGAAVHHSRSAAALTPAQPRGMYGGGGGGGGGGLWAAPPPPAIPGLATGAVFSQPRG